MTIRKLIEELWGYPWDAEVYVSDTNPDGETMPVLSKVSKDEVGDIILEGEA